MLCVTNFIIKSYALATLPSKGAGIDINRSRGLSRRHFAYKYVQRKRYGEKNHIWKYRNNKVGIWSRFESWKWRHINRGNFEHTREPSWIEGRTLVMFPRTSPNGEVIEMSSTQIDLAELQNTYNEALYSSLSFAYWVESIILNHMTDPITMVDLDGLYIQMFFDIVKYPNWQNHVNLHIGDRIGLNHLIAIQFGLDELIQDLESIFNNDLTYMRGNSNTVQTYMHMLKFYDQLVFLQEQTLPDLIKSTEKDIMYLSDQFEDIFITQNFSGKAVTDWELQIFDIYSNYFVELSYFNLKVEALSDCLRNTDVPTMRSLCHQQTSMFLATHMHWDSSYSRSIDFTSVMGGAFIVTFGIGFRHPELIDSYINWKTSKELLDSLPTLSTIALFQELGASQWLIERLNSWTSEVFANTGLSEHVLNAEDIKDSVDNLSDSEDIKNHGYKKNKIMSNLKSACAKHGSGIIMIGIFAITATVILLLHNNGNP